MSAAAAVAKTSNGGGSSDCRWRVVSDPVTCALGLVPPRNMSLTHAVPLGDAIAVTDQARLVTQSTPPFCVVHVNRAFLLLAGLGDSKEHIIGRPVETMVQILPGAMARGPPLHRQLDDKDDDERFFESIVSLRGRVTPCRIRVVPILSQSSRRCRRRISKDRYISSPASSSSAACMSHVLVEVRPPRTTDDQHAALSLAAEEACIAAASHLGKRPPNGSDSKAKNGGNDGDRRSPASRKVFGTVG